MELNELLSKCKVGYCCFKIGCSLTDITSSIPDGCGVYRMYANTKDGELLYIGKCGTVSCNGTYKKQMLRERLNNKQEGLSRKKFLEGKIKSECSLNAIIIEWYILKDASILPAYLEAILIQSYFDVNKKLPRWNKTF
jgi:hypothetical protein